jgi:DNA-binding protein HU-beta
MTKAELINEIAIKTGFDKKTISLIVDGFVENVKKTMISGEGVFMRGFGTFTTKTRKAKIARNITTNTSVQVPQHEIAVFKPAAEFAEALRDIKKK